MPASALRSKIAPMKNLTLYKPDGSPFKDYPDIHGYEVTGSAITFRWERKPMDRTSAEKVVTNLPFFLVDDLP